MVLFRNRILTIVIAATGAAYTFAESVSANIREKEDGWNKFNGGAAAGAIIGATCKCKYSVLTLMHI